MPDHFELEEYINQMFDGGPISGPRLTDDEYLDLFSNTLNAEAGRFMYTDPHLHYMLLRAEGVIVYLRKQRGGNSK